MSGMYKQRSDGGDTIYTAPPSKVKTGGKPSNIVPNGVGFDNGAGYWVSLKLGLKEVRIYESTLRSVLVKALASDDMDVSEVPKVGGRPEQGSVRMNFNDIASALSFMKQCLPKHNTLDFSPNGS